MPNIIRNISLIKAEKLEEETDLAAGLLEAEKSLITGLFKVDKYASGLGSK